MSVAETFHRLYREACMWIWIAAACRGIQWTGVGLEWRGARWNWMKAVWCRAWWGKAWLVERRLMRRECVKNPAHFVRLPSLTLYTNLYPLYIPIHYMPLYTSTYTYINLTLYYSYICDLCSIRSYISLSTYVSLYRISFLIRYLYRYISSYQSI